MEIHILESPDVMAKRVALSIAILIKNNPGRLVCFAAGDTPLGMLRELIRLQDTGACDLNTMYYVGLDEWVGLGYPDKGSCAQVLIDNFYAPAGIAMEKVRLFNGLTKNLALECNRMNDWIATHGGIFLTILGVGLNGHVGFNEPFTPDKEGCIVVELDVDTIAVSEKYFGEKIQVSTGITLGLGTLHNSENLYVLASGKHKGNIIKKAFGEEPTSAVPASLLQRHTNLIVVLDKDASTELIRYGKSEEVKNEAKRILQSGVMEKSKAFILREGNALAPGTPIPNVNAIYEAAEEFGYYNG